MTDIIIPFFNKSGLTIRCINSVVQASALGGRIVLVDDGSRETESNKVLDHIKTSGWPHLFIRKQHNEGYKEAIKTGIKKCTSKYVILLNNDTLLPPRFDESLVNVLTTHPYIKGSAPVSNHPTDLFQFRENLYDVSFDEFQPPAAIQSAFNQRCEVTAEFTLSPYLTGMCLALEKAVFEELGIFEDFYRNGYFEDLDLCCKIRNKGYQLAIVENCFVYHQGHATYRQKSQEEKHAIIFHNFKVFTDRWGHLAEHQDLLLKMKFAGEEDPI